MPKVGLIGLCPFHNDTSPSLVITPDKNLWNCLGACGEGGSVVQFVMKVEGVSLRHAVELLSGNIELGGEGKIKPVKRSSQCKLSED